MSDLEVESFPIGVGRAPRCRHNTQGGGAPYLHESIYRFFDGEGRLLYVGITFSIVSRWAKHRRHKPWWSEVRSATVSCFFGEGLARAAELDAIVNEDPLYNLARPRTAVR